jgi:rhodanese-related sulfurtransferase
VRRGGFLAGGIDAWSAAGEPLQSLQRVATDALEPLIQGESPVQVLDARERSEFEAGHIPGSVHETWHDITGVPEGLDPEQPIAVICAAGLRAGVAASLLQHHGAAKVIHVVDGGEPRRPVEFRGQRARARVGLSESPGPPSGGSQRFIGAASAFHGSAIRSVVSRSASCGFTVVSPA